MRKSRSPSWAGIGMDMWSIGYDASIVIGLRTMKIAMGGAAGEREAKLMVDEKMRAAMEMQTSLLTGRLGTSPARAASATVKHYGRKVRANRRRLGG